MITKNQLKREIAVIEAVLERKNFKGDRYLEGKRDMAKEILES